MNMSDDVYDLMRDLLNEVYTREDGMQAPRQCEAQLWYINPQGLIGMTFDARCEWQLMMTAVVAVEGETLNIASPNLFPGSMYFKPGKQKLALIMRKPERASDGTMFMSVTVMLQYGSLETFNLIGEDEQLFFVSTLVGAKSEEAQWMISQGM